MNNPFKIHHKILIVIALVFNACGFIFRLFVAPGPYDEIAHLITPAIVAYLLCSVAIQRLKLPEFISSRFLLLSIASITVSLCVLWEIVEWVVFSFWPIDNTHTLDDTITDLLYGMIGSSSVFLAAHLHAQIAKSKQQKKNDWSISPQLQ